MAETKKTNEEKLVKIRLPRIPDKNDDQTVFARLNERTFLIKRGVEVEVPEGVAELFRHQEEMEEQAYEFEQEAMK